jgi:uncharacterized protein
MKAFTLFLIFLLCGIAGYYTYASFSYNVTYVEFSEVTATPVEIRLAAVDENGNGVLIPLNVEIKEGTGKILVNIDNPSFIVDTQESMRLAVQEASRITGTNMADKDAIFSLVTGTTIVGGPSAGAAMAVATAASLQGKRVKESVVITGTIRPGGFIGAVGGIKEKAQAAEAAGAELFLVPPGESVIKEPSQNCTEHRIGNTWTRRCVIVNKYIELSQIVSINVMEVSTIDEAIVYMVE